VVKINCFGYYGGDSSVACSDCTARKRCKAILLSDGFDVVADSIEELMAALPDTNDYNDSDRIPALVVELIRTSEKNIPTWFPGSNVSVDEVTADLI